MHEKLDEEMFSDMKDHIKRIEGLTMKFIIGMLLMFGLLSGTAQAFTLTLSGANIDVSYTEPTLNADLSPLFDLESTKIYYDIGSGRVEAMTVPASLSTGGGAILKSVLVPILDGQEVDVIFSVTATDTSGNESTSNDQTIKIDRLAPGPPQ